MATHTEAASKDEIRRRRLVFRCWHRGMREMDLLLGRYADARVAAMSSDELAELERLLDIPDADLFAWLTEARPLPEEVDGRLLDSIRAFHAGRPTVQDADQT